jgi:hypothetical protein
MHNYGADITKSLDLHTTSPPPGGWGGPPPVKNPRPRELHLLLSAAVSINCNALEYEHTLQILWAVGVNS